MLSMVTVWMRISGLAPERIMGQTSDPPARPGGSVGPVTSHVAMEGQSLVYDWMVEPGIVSRRVTLLLRSAEIQPEFFDWLTHSLECSRLTDGNAREGALEGYEGVVAVVDLPCKSVGRGRGLCSIKIGRLSLGPNASPLGCSGCSEAKPKLQLTVLKGDGLIVRPTATPECTTVVRANNHRFIRSSSVAQSLNCVHT